MEKEISNFKIALDFDWEYGVEISQIREDLDAVEKLGGTHIRIESEVSHDCAYTTIEAYAERMETDEEFKERVDSINRRGLKIKQNDLDELERLKLKYESK